MVYYYIMDATDTTTNTCDFSNCESDNSKLYVVDAYRTGCNHPVWFGHVACTEHAHAETSPSPSDCRLCGNLSFVYIDVVSPL